MKNKRTWYRKPKNVIVDEILLKDGKTEFLISSAHITEEYCYEDNSGLEKLQKLVAFAESIGLEIILDRHYIDKMEGIKTKEKQFEEYSLEEFRRAIFYECGKQQYL